MNNQPVPNFAPVIKKVAKEVKQFCSESKDYLKSEHPVYMAPCGVIDFRYICSNFQIIPLEAQTL